MRPISRSNSHGSMYGIGIMLCCMIPTTKTTKTRSSITPESDTRNWVHQRLTWSIHKGLWTPVGWAHVLCVCINKPPLKYAGWPSFDKDVPVYQSPFGIIPLLDEPFLPRGAPSKHLKPGWRYVAWAMQCVLPCAPVATNEDRLSFKRLLGELLAEGLSISSDTFFLELCRRSNNNYVILPPRSKPKKGEEFQITIFLQYVGHLIGHYKAWRVNQKKRAALTVASNSAIVRALRHYTGVMTVPGNFEAQGIPVEPQQSEPVLQSVSRGATEQERASKGTAAGAVPALQFPPPAMHLVPHPYLLIPSLQFRSPAIHLAAHLPIIQARGVPTTTRKRARKVCSKCNAAECNAPCTGKECSQSLETS